MVAWRAVFNSLLVLATSVLVSAGLPAVSALAQVGTAPQVGPVDADFAGVDQAARAYLARSGQPGVAIVVAHADRIIYAQGYGWADRERQIPSSPWLEYRLASVSKTFTAAALMRLVEQGRVQLDAPAWGYVKDFLGEPRDARAKQVTVRQLLTHSWGLDRATTTEPNGRWTTGSQGEVLFHSRDLLRQYLQTTLLDFSPGARYAYNGAGYSWLQLIAETLDGRWLDAQLTALLGPEALSTGRVRIGSTNAREVTLAEPVFYDAPGASQVAPMPGLYAAPAPALVPWPYGGYTLASYGGGGGLMASPLTLARFVQRLQGIRQPALLQPATWAQMRTEQTLADGTRYAGLGVQVAPAYGTDHWITFQGAMPGARTAWLSTPRSAGGPRLTIVALVNGTAAATEDLAAAVLNPVLAAVDQMGAVRYGAKPEIAGDRLIAWGSATHDHFADQLFDWGQRQFPSLFPGSFSAGTYEGYRFRYFGQTQRYLGAKDGRIWLYQPAVSPEIGNIAALVDLLPQATAAPGASSPERTQRNNRPEPPR